MPDTSTEVAIATTTLGSASTTITFSSIPGTYTDLRVVLCGIIQGGNNANGRYNGDTGSNYSNTMIGGDGSSANSYRNTNTTWIRFFDIAAAGGTYPQLITWDIFNYAGSTNKTSLATTSNDGNGSGAVERSVALWRNTAAITSVSIVGTDTFPIGTTATLYGILKA